MKREEIERLLPGVIRRTLYREGKLRPNTPLFVLLEVMEALQGPSDAALRRWDELLDARRTEPTWVPFLAVWLDLERLFEPRYGSAPRPALEQPISTGLGRLRELIATAAHLSKWRGTAKGLLLFLETATGTRGFEVEERVPGPGGQPLPFHVRVRAPAATAAHQALITRIIEIEKPAYVTYELEFETPAPPP